MNSNKTRSWYLYVTPRLDQCGKIFDSRIGGVRERSKFALHLPQLGLFDTRGSDTDRTGMAGAIIGTVRGLPSFAQLDLAERFVNDGLAVFFYWPRETAIERIDRDRVKSLRRHWRFMRAYCKFVGHTSWLELMETPQVEPPGDTPPPVLDSNSAQQLEQACNFELDKMIDAAQPVALGRQDSDGRGDAPIVGAGVYLRLDFWAPIISGGSYGHTCYVAQALAISSGGIHCVMANRMDLLDELGLQQTVLEPPGKDGNELNIIKANSHYHPILQDLFEAERPAYIYERVCLGNYLGALLSQEFGIPYIVEYNGSEISMMRSFSGRGYIHEDLYLKAEDAAFRQATLISVVSEEVRADLLRRGVDDNKILVNPNGASPEAYAPPEQDAKSRLRQEFGWTDDNRVIGFTGTFGGWHGVDVLASALPQICEKAPDARFVLIGDGNYRHLVDAAIKAHGLQSRVHMTGRTTQQEGARLLGACDIFVSPHNSHMVDSKFFGSPTKIFEYMAMGGGIVASDLEQIGVVLAPGISSIDLPDALTRITDERSVLCPPGDIDAFVEAVVALAGAPAAARALGYNARQAVLDHYSWNRHVERIWHFLANGEIPQEFSQEFYGEKNLDRQPAIITGDAYKDEVQNQWDNDPAGSHYVRHAGENTLEWYLEAEAYRYDEYAPWMHETMEFARHADERVLEIGGGMGTDLAQFARHGSIVTDFDLSSGHLAHARENFRLRGLEGKFIHGDAETIPFDDNSFDIVYSNGVIHHTPNTEQVIDHMYRVLRPGGRVIVMVYAQSSLHYWRNIVRDFGIAEGQLELHSVGEIMSRHAELSPSGAAPLVKVYTRKRLRHMFRKFRNVSISQRQITAPEIPRQLKWIPLELAGRLFGWNLIVKGTKPVDAPSS